MTRADVLRIAQAVTPDADPIEIECALYWWAANHHEGQWSAMYSILSTSLYKPGLIERGPEPDTDAEMIYEAMCNEAACTHGEED
jgi:hypothetical protein